MFVPPPHALMFTVPTLLSTVQNAFNFPDPLTINLTVSETFSYPADCTEVTVQYLDYRAAP